MSRGILHVLLKLCFCKSHLASAHHFVLRLGGGGGFSLLEPLMTDDVSDHGSSVRVSLEEHRHQVDEAVAEEASCVVPLVLLPELFDAVSIDQAVVVVGWVGHVEGWVSSLEGEEDHSEGEEVSVVPLVWLLLKDLWRHVAWCADHRVRESSAVTSFKFAGEAEINQLDVVVFVEEDVLRLEVPVREALGVDVQEAEEELACIELDDGLREGTVIHDVVEEFTTFNKLLDNISNALLSSVFVDQNGLLFELHISDDVLMVQGCRGIDLLFQESECAFVELGAFQVENLNRELLIWIMIRNSLSDLSAESFTKLLGESKSVIESILLHVFLVIFVCF